MALAGAVSQLSVQDAGLVASRMLVVALSLDWMELGGEFLHELFGKSEHGWTGLRWGRPRFELTVQTAVSW